MAQQPQLIFYSRNESFTEALCEQLVFENAYRVHVISVLEKAEILAFDGIIVDEPSNDESLISFVQDLLQQKACPLFVTAYTLPQHPLWQQAMIFIKPFPLKDFFKTLNHAVWAHRDKVYEIGSIRFEPGRYRVSVCEGQKNIEIDLTDKETQLLSMLWQRYQTVVLKEELLRTVWGYGSQIETKTLETHIYRLRKKLEMVTSVPLHIRAESSGFSLVSIMPEE